MNKSANPLANRWALLGLVAAFLLLVTELVGTDQHGGVLSQVAGSRSADASDEPAPSVEVIEAAPPEVVDEEEVPEEDMPQIISAEQAEDSDEGAFDSPTDEGDQVEIVDEVVEDDSGE